MMNKIIFFSIGAVTLIAVIVSFTNIDKAPVSRIGYANSSTILRQYGKTQLVIKKIDSLQRQLSTQLESKVNEYKSKVSLLDKNKNQANELIRKDNEEALMAMETSIKRFQARADSALRATQQQLMKPIYDRLNLVISEVAREHGFTHILDNDGNRAILLFGDRATNIDSLVILKLK